MPLRAVSACARAAARRPRPASRRHCRLLVRAFSDSADAPVINGLAEQAKQDEPKVAHFRGTLTAGASGHPLYVDDEHESFDLEFTASRLGFAAYEGDGEHDEHEENHIREESREEAAAKAERILAILRHSMTELDIGRVIHRISQFATTPRVTIQTRKQFFKALEARFGPDHEREHELVLDFLLGKDQVIDQLKDESRDTMDVLSSSSSVTAQGDELAEREVVVPEIMGLHPELVADPKFIGVVFCYCRMACLNSQKLVRPPNGQHRHPKSSLLQVKHDFRRVLDSEGLSHFAEMMGIKGETREDEETLDTVDAEWEEFNLENDRIDFRMLVAKTQELIAHMKHELSDETITKMLIAMLASLKTTKLHRKIFQEMVCNIQAALPERSHEAVLRQLVPFLSGNQATYDDFESEIASTALNHHRSRHEAILRALLETRMRLGHILIHDLDAIDPMASISPKLAPEVREKVITVAWNIVSVLNDREYHVFFSRFLKHKLAWRPSRTTFGQTFLDDVRKTLGPRKAEAIMPLFEEVFPHLSVETLTICRVKLRHSRKLVREAAAVTAINDLGRERLEEAWRADRSVFYRNLPFGVTEKHLRASLDHIGRVKRFVFFSNPVNGPPDEIEEDEATLERATLSSMGSDEDEDEEIESFPTDLAEEEEEEDDEDFNDDVIAALIKKLGPKDTKLLQRELKTPRKKGHVIASDTKTTYNAVVEFESPTGRERALQQSLQIFGVMMGGWKEYRPVFSSPSEERASVSVQNIPFGTSIDALLTEMNAILHKEGLAVDLSSKLPRGVVITSGRLELRFASFTEAAQVVEVLHKYVSHMKSRRDPTGEELMLEIVRQKRRKHQQKVAKAEERRAKRAAKKRDNAAAALAKREAKKALAGGETVISSHLSYRLRDEDDEDDIVDDEEEEEEELEDDDDDVDENEDMYFAWEEEAERALSDELRALRDVPRPFDVTFNRLPREKNKHMYV